MKTFLFGWKWNSDYYLRQGGYVFVVLCLSVCLFVWATLRKKLPNGFAWNFQGRLAMGQRTNDYIMVAIRIATLVRCTLAEVRTVPVLLVIFTIIVFIIIFLSLLGRIALLLLNENTPILKELWNIGALWNWITTRLDRKTGETKDSKMKRGSAHDWLMSSRTSENCFSIRLEALTTYKVQCRAVVYVTSVPVARN